MSDDKETLCELCGEPMPPDEQMFRYHGIRCPRPPMTPMPQGGDNDRCRRCGHPSHDAGMCVGTNLSFEGVTVNCGCEYLTRHWGTGAEMVEIPDPRIAWEAAGWQEESCGCSNGLEWGGEEPRECRRCGGSGGYWRSPKGKHALYPGGPFCG